MKIYAIIAVLLILGGAVMCIYRQGKKSERLDNIKDETKKDNKFLKRVAIVLADSNRVFKSGVQYTIKNWKTHTSETKNGMDSTKKG